MCPACAGIPSRAATGRAENAFRLAGIYDTANLTPDRYQLAALDSPATASFTIAR
jgi:hypothetical protein